MLHFGTKPPFTFAKFLELCQGLISGDDMALLESSHNLGTTAHRSPGSTTLRRWQSFEKALRNEVVKVRAHSMHVDPAPYLAPDGSSELALTHVALAAYRNPALLEAEKFLDETRWQRLEELASGHYFDMDFLVTYAQKLLILERWERIHSADKEKLLKETLQKST